MLLRVSIEHVINPECHRPLDDFVSRSMSTTTSNLLTVGFFHSCAEYGERMPADQCFGQGKPCLCEKRVT